jgi:predicted amidohydrolase
MLPFTHVSRATVPAHAANGGMTIVYANFCGREGDLTYAGRSLIAGPHGEVVVEAGADATALIVAEMPAPDPERSFDQLGDYREVR